MPKFFFHLLSRDIRIMDDSGKELSGLAAAHLHARQLMFKIQMYLGADDDEPGWLIRVCSAESSTELLELFPTPPRTGVEGEVHGA
jgi:hypothetical protein